MKTVMLGFIAETLIHCGTGRSAGIIDLPFAREAATDFPFIAGSSLKGALRDRARRRNSANDDDSINCVFGDQNKAGSILVSDARLLLLPVRCLSGTYRWVTCPLLIERYQRDLKRCAIPITPPTLSVQKPDETRYALANESDNGTLWLEELEFELAGECPSDLVQAIVPAIKHLTTRDRLASQLVVVSDDDFAWFARYALSVQARNVLDKETKTSKNIWYEESLPPDTVLYAMITARNNDDAAGLAADWFTDTDPYLQVGGNETVGFGWVAVSLISGGDIS